MELPRRCHTVSTVESKSKRQQKRASIASVMMKHLFQGVDGKEMSKRYITSVIGESESSSFLTYGEIVHQSFLQLLALTYDESRITQ